MTERQPLRWRVLSLDSFGEPWNSPLKVPWSLFRPDKYLHFLARASSWESITALYY